MNRTHWLGENVRTLATTLGELPEHLPLFDRYRFGRNRFRDVIVRRARGRANPIPVGLVSKRYVLVQHAATILAVIREIEKAGIDPRIVPATLLITEYGTRMALRATLPASHAFTPSDGHPMALTFECFNSVDGTVPLFAVAGWLRFVCSNGMVVGEVAARVRRKHSPPLAIEEISDVLAQGVECALQDHKTFTDWRSTEIPATDLEKWVDGPVTEAWGPLAAARVHGIATTGLDGKPAPPRKKARPHTWSLQDGQPVPGTTAPCSDAYQLVQVLSWVASRRRNVAQRLQWRGQIRTLMADLV
jgi:hypothetical protein